MNFYASFTQEDSSLPLSHFLLTGIQIICVTNTVLVFPALVPFKTVRVLQGQCLPHALPSASVPDRPPVTFGWWS